MFSSKYNNCQICYKCLNIVSFAKVHCYVRKETDVYLSWKHVVSFNKRMLYFIFDNFNRILIVHFMHYAIVSTTSQQTFRISWKAYTENIEWLCIMTYLFIVHVLHCKQVLVVLCWLFWLYNCSSYCVRIYRY